MIDRKNKLVILWFSMLISYSIYLPLYGTKGLTRLDDKGFFELAIFFILASILVASHIYLIISLIKNYTYKPAIIVFMIQFIIPLQTYTIFQFSALVLYLAFISYIFYKNPKDLTEQFVFSKPMQSRKKTGFLLIFLWASIFLGLFMLIPSDVFFQTKLKKTIFLIYFSDLVLAFAFLSIFYQLAKKIGYWPFIIQIVLFFIFYELAVILTYVIALFYLIFLTWHFLFKSKTKA